MPSSPGHTELFPLTNGHASPFTINPYASDDLAHEQSESDQSPPPDTTVEVESSDEDAPGEEYDESPEMEVDSDSSEDVDAEGEPDGDYDSESPPPAQADSSRSRSSTSQESRRPQKRKASVEEDSFITQNPELYGLRRSVRGIPPRYQTKLTMPQGRARLNRRIVCIPLLARQTLG